MLSADKTDFEVFAGIGGGALASKRRGFNVVGLCEFDKAAVRVLKKRYVGVPIFKDITTTTGAGVIKRCGPVYRLSGGSPCQDLSLAGKKAGFDDGVKSSLIWHQVRLLKELGAAELFWENVYGALAPTQEKGFKKFLAMLTEAGYGGAYCVLGSAHVGTNHVRPRVWLLAVKGEKGFRLIETAKYPKKRYFVTPMANDARAGRHPMPANLRRNSPPLPCQLFPQLKKGMTMEQIRAIIGDKKHSAEWVESMQGFPLGWTNPAVSNEGLIEHRCDISGKYLYPNYDKRPPHPWEPKRHVILSTEAEEALWEERIKQLGNCQHPEVAELADKILTHAIYGRRSLFSTGA